MASSRKGRRAHDRPRSSGVAAVALPPATQGYIAWLFGLAFLAVNLLLSSYFLDSVPSPNPTSRALPVLAVYEQGTYAIDAYEKSTMDKSFVNGHYYSDKAPLSTWIVLPFYGLLRAAHLADPGSNRPRWISVTWLGDFLCGSVPFAMLTWLVLRKIAPIVRVSDAVLLCMLPLYGSFVFAYAGVFMSHVLAGALLCGSYMLLQRRTHLVVCGLLIGLAVLAEFPTALALPIWAVTIWRRNRRELWRFALGGLPCAIALLLYNHAITGSATTMAYDYIADSTFSQMRSGYGLGLPQADAIWGLLFSTYRGMFYYAPSLTVIAFAYLLTRGSHVLRVDLFTPLGVLAVCYVALISSYFVWWGGWAYGPRHLIPLAMLLFYEGIPMLARTGRFRGWLYLASAVGIAMVWIAKATALYIMPEQFSNPVFDLALPSLLRGQLRHDALPTLLFGIDPLIGASIWIVLFVVCVWGLRTLARRGSGGDRGSRGFSPQRKQS
jgi:hypothetical protein